MKAKTKREEVLMDVIEHLVKEKNKWELRVKHPLPEGWSYGEDHPRLGEILSAFSNILTKG